ALPLVTRLRSLKEMAPQPSALSPQSAARSPQPEGSFCRSMEGLGAFSRPELRVAGSSDENTKL
ncbi:hypothetical protein, partial [Adlercreutzia sp.]|uniref:hypothetical protein n=1 Tax=Adlercreutzia sp. TaxID=1872387 RepID=UPI003FD786FC